MNDILPQHSVVFGCNGEHINSCEPSFFGFNVLIDGTNNSVGQRSVHR